MKPSMKPPARLPTRGIPIAAIAEEIVCSVPGKFVLLTLPTSHDPASSILLAIKITDPG